MHAEYESDDTGDIFLAEVELLFHVKHHVKMSWDFNMSLISENIFKLTTENESLHKISDENEVKK
jgi:hypothetical protein